MHRGKDLQQSGDRSRDHFYRIARLGTPSAPSSVQHGLGRCRYVWECLKPFRSTLPPFTRRLELSSFITEESCAFTQLLWRDLLWRASYLQLNSNSPSPRLRSVRECSPQRLAQDECARPSPPDHSSSFPRKPDGELARLRSGWCDERSRLCMNISLCSHPHLAPSVIGASSSLGHHHTVLCMRRCEGGRKGQKMNGGPFGKFTVAWARSPAKNFPLQ